jgi:preprotein translocase subunit SecD
LTYKVDYSKYKELYPMQQEFLDVRARVESIILKNIDTRISTLGVSDYTAYPQQLNDDYYIIVELGGVQNIDQAKDMIGKTVELEFKLPNEGDVSPTSRAQRQLIAEQILTQALQNPDAFMQLGQ